MWFLHLVDKGGITMHKMYQTMRIGFLKWTFIQFGNWNGKWVGSTAQDGELKLELEWQDGKINCKVYGSRG